MKHLLLFITLILISSISFSQVIDPVPGLKANKKSRILHTRYVTIKEEIKENKVVKKDTTTKEDTTVKHDILTEDRISIFGLTALNNSTNDVLSSLNGTGRLGMIFYPGLKKRFKINMGVNLLNANPSKGIKRDSVDFNSLMFPETGNFGYLFSPSFRLNKNGNKENNYWIEASFAYRKVAVDSPSISFKAVSYNIGIKYEWDYVMEDDNRITFSLMPYFNLFNIPNEDVKKFKSLIKDPLFENTNRGAVIPSFGVKNSMQYKNFIFFFDIRYNMKTSDLDDDNPIKGTKVNVGFVTAFSLKSF